MKKILFLSFSLLILLLFGCQLKEGKESFLLNNEELNNVNEIVNLLPPIEETKIPRLLDGVPVKNGQENQRPVSVLLDNFPGAPRPSLSSASLVYEAPVEGGLTRFLAIFDPNDLSDNLGPIRSARPYFAEIASEYRALYIHAGGSPEALLKLKQGFYNVVNLDEISSQGKYFYRQPNEPAPHNLYIKKESVIKFLEDNKISTVANFIGWYYDKEARLGDQMADKIKITFSPLNESVWHYDQNNKDYLYLPNGKSYRDKDNQEIRVKNLIVQYTPIKILDKIGRREINLNGQGEALIFQNGKVIKGKWFKEAGRTKFYDSVGEEITFFPGKTWISIISSANQVNY